MEALTSQFALTLQDGYGDLRDIYVREFGWGTNLSDTIRIAFLLGLFSFLLLLLLLLPPFA